MRTCSHSPLSLAPLLAASSRKRLPIRERARAQNKLGWEDMSGGIVGESREVVPECDRHRPLSRCRTTAWAAPAWRSIFAARSPPMCDARSLSRAGRKAVHQCAGSAALPAGSPDRDRRTDPPGAVWPADRGPPGHVRQLQNVAATFRRAFQRGNNMSIESSVPAWVSLALGSAYFRSGTAERRRAGIQGGDRR